MSAELHGAAHDELAAAQEAAAVRLPEAPRDHGQEQEALQQQLAQAEAPLSNPGSSDSPLASFTEVKEQQGEMELRALCQRIRERGDRVTILVHPPTNEHDPAIVEGSVNSVPFRLRRNQPQVVNAAIVETLYRAEVIGNYPRIGDDGRKVMDAVRIKRFPFTILDPGYLQLSGGRAVNFPSM